MNPSYRACPSEKRASVSGSGIAALACHTLLGRFGWSTGSVVVPTASVRPPVPFVVVNANTWRVIQDIFSPPSAYVTTHRIVVKHSKEIFNSDETHYVLAAADLAPPFFGPLEGDERIETLPTPATETWISSGNRVSFLKSAVPVSPDVRQSLLFEFVPEGWVFWAPTAPDEGFVQFVLPDRSGGQDACRDLWRSTRLAQHCVELTGDSQTKAIPSAARLNRSVATPGVICCGSAALRYDPIAGDGTGASLRSAILACAAVRYAAAHPGSRSAVLGHYQARIARAYCDHLAVCERLYREANLSSAWDAEQFCLAEARRIATPLLAESCMRFRLENLSLISF